MNSHLRLILVVLFFAFLIGGARAESAAIGGLYEVCIGTNDALMQIRYWERFGFTVGQSGELNADEALRLYGVKSRLRSIRLNHQDADHGLIRLMIWEQPVNEGLQLSPMKVLGNRWASMMTADLYNVLNHAEAAQSAGLPIYFVAPQRNVIPSPLAKPVPFIDPIFTIRDFVLIQPFARQVMFQRFGYTRPLYGRINEASFFRASQVTHVGLVTSSAQSSLKFYDEVLGLLRTEDNRESDYRNVVARNLFDLQPGERYFITSFDDPRSSTEFEKMRSGRLIVFRFPPELNLTDKRIYSRPGSLGVSLYTCRVKNLAEYHARIRAGAATNLTEIITNEFGERSLSFTAPDGYFWTLME